MAVHTHDDAVARMTPRTVSDRNESPVPERDAARIAGTSVPYLRLARREGRGPAYLRYGRMIKYLPSDVVEWRNSHRVRTREAT